MKAPTTRAPGARLDYTLREPVGVTGHIAPWNYPLVLACRGIAPALAAGNTVVLKPASLTPLSALKVAELAAAVGFPPGVFNIVTGPGSSAGAALAGHPDVDSMTFTGSTETGKQIMQLASRNVTPVTLELGGKNPQIVFPDAKIDKALKGVLFGAFQNAGQMCWAGSRLYVHESVRDDFLHKLAENVQRMKLGPGTKEDTQMGPVVSRQQEASVLEYVKVGAKEGATVLVGGKRAEAADLKEGNFVLPTVFTDVDPSMRIAREEIFGPVLSTCDFKDVDEVVAEANATNYGLIAGGGEQKLPTPLRVAGRLEAGVGDNNQEPATVPPTPFHGVQVAPPRAETGVDAVNFYTRVKTVNVSLE